MNRCKSI